MLSACSPCVFSNAPTSVLSRASNWINSRLRSSLTASAPRIFASISPIVFSIIIQNTRRCGFGKRVLHSCKAVFALEFTL